MSRRFFFFPHGLESPERGDLKKGSTPSRVPFEVNGTLVTRTGVRESDGVVMGDGYRLKGGDVLVGGNQDPFWDTLTFQILAVSDGHGKCGECGMAALAVAPRIRLLRRERVMLDDDLAALYGVETRALLQAVKRNMARFPPDFMFQLSSAEYAVLRSQTVILDAGRGADPAAEAATPDWFSSVRNRLERHSNRQRERRDVHETTRDRDEIAVDGRVDGHS